jgi:hypothetical protein
MSAREQRCTLTLPTIHTNGTGKAQLIEALCDAGAALRAAIAALADTAPNGRDYYPQGDGALRAALQAHESRVQRVGEVRREIAELAEAIDAIPDWRQHA